MAKWGEAAWLRGQIAAAEKAFEDVGLPAEARRWFDVYHRSPEMTESLAYRLVAAQEAACAAEQLLKGLRGRERDAAWYLLGIFGGVAERRDAGSAVQRAWLRTHVQHLNARRTAARIAREAKWKETARAVWKKDRSLKIVDVAESVLKVHPCTGAHRTVRRAIANLTPER